MSERLNALYNSTSNSVRVFKLLGMEIIYAAGVGISRTCIIYIALIANQCQN